jgi:hypothetical protein
MDAAERKSAEAWRRSGRARSASTCEAATLPPGNMVTWRGLSRMTDVELGAAIGAKIVGN